MEKPDMLWIDKIFNCLKLFYGDRWSKQFNKSQPEDLVKSVWQSALIGCSYDEIRNILLLLQQVAKNPTAKPPHQLEFWCYVKGYKRPSILYGRTIERGNRDVAKKALDEINEKLRFRSKVLRGT